MNNKLMLIDGNSLIHRSFHALANSKAGILKNAEGIPVNSILVFAKMINKFLHQYNPSHLLIAFDAGKKTKRHNEYPDYKAKRPKTPTELIIQIPLIKEMLNHMNIKHFELIGFEADDIIATAVKKFQNNSDIFIISSDQDMFQLINKNTKIIYPQTGNKEAIIYQYDSFSTQKGYKPSQVTDIKGLVGDVSDNLPGVKGIGPKTATELINKYHNLEGIYNNIENIKGTLKDKLLANKDNAKLSKKLATLETNINLDLNLKTIKWSFANINKSLLDFFEKMGTKSLISLFNKNFEKKNIQKPLSDKIFF